MGSSDEDPPAIKSKHLSKKKKKFLEKIKKATQAQDQNSSDLTYFQGCLVTVGDACRLSHLAIDLLDQNIEQEKFFENLRKSTQRAVRRASRKSILQVGIQVTATYHYRHTIAQQSHGISTIADYAQTIPLTKIKSTFIPE